MKIWSRQLKVTWEAHAGRWIVRPGSSSVQPIQEVNSRLGFATCTSREWPAKFPCFTKNCDFLYSHHSYYIYTHTIYTLITHRKCKKPIERKTLRKVSTTHPPYLRESYSFLERNLSSLFSFPLQLLYPLRGDLYPNITYTHSKCWECFWSLGLFQLLFQELKDIQVGVLVLAMNPRKK